MESEMKAAMMHRLLATAAVIILAGASATHAAEPAVKILLIGKDRDHPFTTHEYMADCGMLALCLEQTPGVEAVVSNGWPVDPEVLTGVNAIVLYTCNGGDVLLARTHRKQVDELLKNGVGLTAIHWGTGANKDVGEAWQQALGAWFSTDFSTYLVRTTKLQQADSQHPVCFGWKGYDLRDEFYIHLKFQPKTKPVMKAAIDGQEHVLGWTYERPKSNGGRSFGFVCGHFHDNFGQKPFRQAIVNGILWTAKLEVPETGASCKISTQDMELPPDTRQEK
jgi:type 1 glutamine amidotransferase